MSSSKAHQGHSRGLKVTLSEQKNPPTSSIHTPTKIFSELHNPTIQQFNSSNRSITGSNNKKRQKLTLVSHNNQFNNFAQSKPLEGKNIKILSEYLEKTKQKQNKLKEAENFDAIITKLQKQIYQTRTKISEIKYYQSIQTINETKNKQNLSIKNNDCKSRGISTPLKDKKSVLDISRKSLTNKSSHSKLDIVLKEHEKNQGMLKQLLNEGIKKYKITVNKQQINNQSELKESSKQQLQTIPHPDDLRKMIHKEGRTKQQQFPHDIKQKALSIKKRNNSVKRHQSNLCSRKSKSVNKKRENNVSTTKRPCSVNAKTSSKKKQFFNEFYTANLTRKNKKKQTNKITKKAPESSLLAVQSNVSKQKQGIKSNINETKTKNSTKSQIPQNKKKTSKKTVYNQKDAHLNYLNVQSSVNQRYLRKKY